MAPDAVSPEKVSDTIPQCARCGAIGTLIGGDEDGWFCAEANGGCGRVTARNGASGPLDPAYEKITGMNGSSSLSSTLDEHPDALLDGLPPTDVGNGVRLVNMHGEMFRYVHEWGWLVWTGARWQRDRTDLLYRFGKDVCRQMVAAGAEILSEYASDAQNFKLKRQAGIKGSKMSPQVEKATALIEWAETSQGERRIKAMLEMARSEADTVAVAQAFDADPFLLNCTNATIDLRNGEPRIHERTDYLTKKCPTPYDADAKSPLWDKFLSDVFGDAALVSYIARVVGYVLTGSGKEQVVFILHGTGSNGKSTFLNTLLKVLGKDYAAQIDASTITGGRKGGASNDIARLRGIRFVSSIEVGEGRRLNEALVKQFTGGDTIAARFLYKEFFEFEPEFKLFIAANHKPEVQGQDHATWRRVRLVPFEKTFTDATKDPELPAKLLAEARGILAWAVRGCLDWQKNGLLTPEVVKAATLAYKSEMNELEDFLGMYTWNGPALSCGAGELYGKYREWEEERHNKPMAQQAFGRRMHDLGFGSGKDRGVRVWHGLSTAPPPRTLDSVLE